MSIGTSPKTDIGLRIGGLFLLALGTCAMKLLYRQVLTLPASAITPLEMCIAALGFLGVSAGIMLAALGHRILDPVEISARWIERPPSDRQ